MSLWFFIWLLGVASAQEPTLPVLLSAPPPTWPAAARAEQREARVLLSLTIDEDGRVVLAEVSESAGFGFDEAALDAARALRFTPALDARGRPSTAMIQYAITFTLDSLPARSVEGVVRESGVRVGLSGVTIRLSRVDNPPVDEGPGDDPSAALGVAERFVTTDDDGAFAVDGLADGPWLLTASTPGFRDVSTEVIVRDGAVQQATLWMVRTRPWEAEERIAAEIDVIGFAANAEVTERVLTTADIAFLPGTNGDVVKVVQSLPGVARPPLGIGQLLIRGTAPEDSKFYLDGVRLPLVFHFAGLSTVINGDFLEEVRFLPGNYSSRYGRTLGGVLDLRTSDALPDRSDGNVFVDLYQSGLFVRQRVSPTMSLTVSGRRSYIDGLLTPLLTSLTGSTFRAPVYQDLQVRALDVKPNGQVLDLMVIASDDTFKVLGEDDASVTIGLQTRFSRMRLRHLRPLGAGWSSESVVSLGPERQAFQFGDNGDAFESAVFLDVRQEFVRGFDGGWSSFRGGLDLRAGRDAFRYDVSAFGAREDGRLYSIYPGFYAEPSFRRGDVELRVGGRVDPWLNDAGANMVAVDPRASVRWEATDTTLLLASLGSYSQLPTARQVLDPRGGAALGAQRAIQASVGLRQVLAADWSLELTAFGSQLTDLVSGRQDAFQFFTGPPPVGPFDTGDYANDGRGRIYGAEGLLRLDGRRTIGWLSATWSRSLRTDRPGQEERLFNYDQPLILTALATHPLPQRWRLGARVRYASGNPYTPVVNRVFDVGSQAWRPVYGPRDSERLPGFFSADVRIDKTYVFRTWELSFYLDLQNATNQQNIDVIGFNFDFSAEDPINGLPLLPAFGVKGAW